MAELLDILDAFTTPLKVAWVVWLAWGIAQIFWYRYERRPQAANRAAVTARKPFVSKPSKPERSTTRLVTPEQVMPQQPAFADTTPPEGPGPIGEIDQFVASFEMNTRSRREQPLNGEQVPFGS
ncbi:MAG TPA: hypothetical protein VMS40_13250 [Vicinamibacterales bacterium]|nr:hypothetical protein [Vicinamibacterales bacterium]